MQSDFSFLSAHVVKAQVPAVKFTREAFLNDFHEQNGSKEIQSGIFFIVEQL